jgi:hypothetical protein
MQQINMLIFTLTMTSVQIRLLLEGENHIQRVVYSICVCLNEVWNILDEF